MKITLLLLPLLFISLITVSAQSYELTVDEVAYLPLENSISLTNGEEWDDEEYNIALDYDVVFFGDSFRSLVVNANGLVSNIGFDTYDNITGLFSFNADLIDRGYDSGEALSNISYLIEGEAGSRILKIEWSNIGFYDEYYLGNTESFANIQIWIYENDESIEYRFGNNLIASEFLFDYYGGGPVVGLLHNYDGDTELFDEFSVLTGDPANPAILLFEGELDLEYSDLLDGAPAANTRYRFTRMDVSTNEIKDRSSEYAISPNPASTVLNLVKSADANEIKNISIYSNNGKLIKIITSDYSNINISDLTNGVYHLNIFTTDGLAVKRFVKIE